MRNYLKSALTGFLVCVIVICYESQLLAAEYRSIFRLVSDGAFVAGAVLISIGAMTFIASAGLFDAFTFLASSIVWTFSPRKGAFDKRMKYFDYKLEKAKKRANGEKSCRYILITGVIFLLLSIVLAFL